MRFSVWPNAGQPWDQILDVARHAEATGWDGVWIADHFMPLAEGPADGPMLECWSLLAGLAASVPRVRLGALVTGNTYRHPAVLANVATAVDHIAGPGRLVLGIGAGWQENEHKAYGIDFGTSAGERLARLDEACSIIRGLLDSQRTTFEGRHYQVTDAPNDPKPLSPKLPLLIGGGGERVTLKIAANHADEWNVWGDPATLASKGQILERHCADLGRDPAQIQRSAQALLFLSTDEDWLKTRRQAGAGRATIVGTPAEVTEIVGAYRDAGVDELIIPDFTLSSGERRLNTLDLFTNEVAPAFR